MARRGKSTHVGGVGEKITRRWLSLVAAIWLIGASGLGAVQPGTARVNVLQELGTPLSALARGGTEVMTYPGGVRVTLKDGRVTEITGLKPAAAAPAAAAPAPEQPKEPAPSKAQIDEQARMEKKFAEADGKARTEMEKSITELENMHSQPSKLLMSQKFNAGNFLFGLALKWVLTLAALKLTCKYWGAEVFWNGLMTVALVDVLVRGVIGFIGLKLLSMMSLFYADEAAASAAMVLVLRKVSINQSLAQAVQITMTTKTFTVVVGSFLVTVLLQMMN